MNYILCHKDIEVLNFEIINDEIYDIHTINNEDHLPLFLKGKTEKNKVIAFREWWKGRCIPSSRQNLDNFLKETNESSLNSIIIKSLGLSLSDQYWIKPEKSHLKWKEVNFYENEFSSDVGDLFFGIKLKKQINFLSPDNTSDGWLLKKWIIKDGNRFLIKGGSEPYTQEPFNEVLATKICDCLNIPHANYTLVKINEDYFSSCNNITNVDTELVSAWNILNTRKKEKRIPAFENFIKCCTNLNIGSEEKLNDDIGKMILLDFIIANTDRHYNNFSFLRNSNTLEWMGLAPIFDTGTSMFNKISTEQLKNLTFTDSKNIKSKPFYTRQQKQLEKFATNIALQNIDFDSLNNIPEFYSKLLSLNKKISEERRILLTAQLKRRIEHSKSIVFRRNEITKEFLRTIYENKTSATNIDKISSAFSKIISENAGYKQILDNYLKVINPKNEKEMEQLILKDVSYFFEKRKKTQTYDSNRGL